MKKTNLLIGLMLGFYLIAQANEIHIPADYPTIQQGIDASSNSDIVLVSPGTYFENIDFDSKSITVKSSEGYQLTVIDGSQHDSLNVISYQSYDDIRPVIEGFTISNGDVGIFSLGSITIRNNRIVNNNTGIFIYPWRLVPYPIITDNMIEDNHSGILVGIPSKGPSIPTIRNNIIKGNSGTGIMIMGTWSLSSKVPLVFNNLISNNGSGISILNRVMTANYADVSLGNNTIVDNSEYGIQCIWASPIISDCIIWNNNDDLNFTLVSSSTLVIFSDIKDGDYISATGNKSNDPLFVDCPFGSYYLSNLKSGQNQQSPCVDSGSLLAAVLNLNDRTTCTDQTSDEGQVDMGFHYKVNHQTTAQQDLVAEIPETFGLEQNYPNPFNPVTTVDYQLPKSSEVVLRIYSISGQVIKLLVDEKQQAGRYAIQWDGKDDRGLPVASGVYVYCLSAGDFVQVRKMILVR